MGFSFHDENSLVEASTESLCFVSANDPNPIARTGVNKIVDHERRDNDLRIVDSGLYDDLHIQIIDWSEVKRQRHETSSSHETSRYRPK